VGDGAVDGIGRGVWLVDGGIDTVTTHTPPPTSSSAISSLGHVAQRRGATMAPQLGQ
jgi:hypothetical protein